jgi:DNA-binding transcriptional MerR regulator
MSPEQVKEAIEKYHQDNYYSLYPAGRVPEWVNEAVVENVAKPLIEENERLKQQVAQLQKAS